MLRIIVIAILLACSCHIAAAQVQYQRHEELPDFKSLRQKRATEKPYFFAQIQSYRLVENYLHYWIDRPLFHDSELRAGESYRSSFLRNVAILKDYEIDGFTSLSNGLMKMYGEHIEALEGIEPRQDFNYMPGAMYAADYNPQKPDDKWMERYLTAYGMAEKSPHTLKINGKIPVWAYNSQSLKPSEMKSIGQTLRSKTTTEPLLFAELNDASYQTLYNNRGKLSEIQTAQLRKLIEETLDVAGGLVVKPVMSVSEGKGAYVSKPSVSGYYRDYLVPMLVELLQQAQYQDKLIGAYVSKGYLNHLSGNNSGEYGTYRFRLFMSELMLLNPDVVVLFEWNEANENTHFQPTVNDSKTMQRLVKYYARRLRGQAPTANSGDDLSIPNLVFSSRQVLRLGDTLRYELLNIPDSNSSAQYQVQLVMRDYHGRILQSFPGEKFTVSQFKAIRFDVPTEQLAGHTLILPELRITNATGRQKTFAMQYNRIHPSVCWNYKEIMQPLRDMLPLQPKFEVKATQSGTYEIAASADSPENLLQFEVTDNEDEVYAVDREKRYDPEKNVIIQGSLTAFSTSTRNVTFEVKNAPGWQWFRDVYRYRPDNGDPQIIDNKATVPDYFIDFYYRNPFNITVPKDRVANAVLEIAITGLGKHSFKVSELQKLGKMAKAFDGNSRLDLNIVKNLVDIPVPLQQQSVNFTTTLETESRFPVYQLRAISKSGKVFRSRPIMPLVPRRAAVAHAVFSESKKRPVTVSVAQDRIPDLVYEFDGARGALLKNSWEPFYDGQLGGGFTYLEPFNRPRPNLLAIPGRKFLHPAWKEGEGTQVLEFDGKANYINLPREAMPYGSFGLEFEIKPEGSDTQVLFRNFSNHHGSLNLFRRGRKLEAVFSYRTGEPGKPIALKEFKTDLEIAEGQWSQVKVGYNLEELSFIVNGKIRRFPFSERGAFFKPSVFGGHIQPESLFGKGATFFKGQLRSLRIVHGTYQSDFSEKLNH